MTVHDMLGGMTSMELTYWVAYFKLEQEDRLQAEAASRAQAELEALQRRRRR